MTANAIQLSTSLTCVNGSLDIRISKTKQIDQTTAKGGNPGTVNIGTSEEVLAFGDITSLGIVWLLNMDATNFVELGPESSGAMVAALKLKAGEGYAIRLKPGVTWRAKADTAAVNLFICALDD